MCRISACRNKERRCQEQDFPYSGRGMEECHLKQTPAETVTRNFITFYEAYS